MRDTILIRPASMWPIYLPATNNLCSRWLNLANAEQIIILSKNPLRIEIVFNTTKYYEDKNSHNIILESIQAQAIIKALEEFQQPPCQCREPVEEDA